MIKRRIFLLLFLFFAGNVPARSFEGHRLPTTCSEEYRMQIPGWFLFPFENEYVGVSLPSSNPEERMCSALISALISYEAHVSRPFAINRAVEEDKNGIRRDIQQGAREIDDGISFRIIRQFVNGNDELFVALQIIPDSSEYLRLAIAKEIFLQKDVDATSWEYMESIECTYAEMAYCFSRQDKNREIRGEIVMKNKDQGIYHDLKNCLKTDYIDIKNATDELGWSYDCNKSLHVAYVEALCNLIIRGTTLKYPCSLINNRLIFYYHD